MLDLLKASLCLDSTVRKLCQSGTFTSLLLLYKEMPELTLCELWEYLTRCCLELKGPIHLLKNGVGFFCLIVLVSVNVLFLQCSPGPAVRCQAASSLKSTTH